MGILGRIASNAPFRGQRPSAPAPQASGSMPPPPPIPGQGKKPSAPPPISKGKTAGDIEKGKIQSRITDIRMQGDQHRQSGNHASAEGKYRMADEMETRLKLGQPQLSDKSMRDVRGGQGRTDDSGTKWGGY